MSDALLISILILGLGGSCHGGYDCIRNCGCEKRDNILVADCAGANHSNVPHPDVQYGIRVLLLQSNHITQLHTGDFRPFKGLKELYVSGNGLNRIENDAFDGLQSLVKLDVSNNQLSDLPGLRKLSRNLRWLSLSENAFQHIPESLAVLRNLLYLDISGNKLIDRLPPDSLPPSLNELYMSYTSVKRFTKATFARLGELRILRVSDNLATSAVEFDEKVFDDLDLLEQLDVSRCLCGNLHGDSFAKLRNLEKLILDDSSLAQAPVLYKKVRLLPEYTTPKPDISNARPAPANSSTTSSTAIDVTSINEELVWYNPKLKILDLSNNPQMAVIPKMILAPPSLIELRLEYNNVTTIVEEFLVGIPLVQRLNLCYSGVREVKGDALVGVRNLSEICLSGNPLEVVPHLPASLVKLNISETRIRNIRGVALGKLSNVVEANISHGMIENIDEYAFGNMTSLQKLDLSSNIIEAIGRNSLRIGRSNAGSTVKTRSNLVDLNLSCNLLKKIESDAFSTHAALQVLDLGDNLLEIVLSETFEGLKNLMKLQLSHNSIIDVTPRAFAGLVNLKILHLEHNRIEVLHSGTFDGMGKLQELYLHHNSLVYARHYALSSLQYLDVSYNNITTFPKIGGKSLREVNASGNVLGCLTSKSMRYMPRLQKLDLSYCKIVRVDYSVFRRAPSLKELNLTGNQITGFPDQKMPNLEVLAIKNNKVRIVARPLKTVAPKLQTLDLSYNNISDIDPRIFRTSDSLTEVKLSGNGFLCDCDLIPLVEWMANHQSMMTDAQAFACEGHRGKSVLKVLNTLDCDYSQGAGSRKTTVRLAVAVAVSLVTIILIVSTCFLCKRVRNQNGDGVSYSNGEVRVITDRRSCCTSCVKWTFGINVYARSRGRFTSEESRDLVSPVTSPIDKEAPIPL